MSKITGEVVKKAMTSVLHVLEEKLTEDYCYHNAAHTQNVYMNSRTIGEEEGLSSNDMYCLLMAALFHDIGYVDGGIDHEFKSAQQAAEFLREEGIDKVQIDQVERAILATKVPQKPKDIISKVLCDADMMHLSSIDYFEQMELLRKEWKHTGKADLSEREFHMQSVGFFNSHNYHTRFGKDVLSPKKKKILDLILAKI